MQSIDWGKVITSKTVWIGILMLTVAILEYVAGLPKGTSIIQAISGAMTIIVRFLTKDSLLK